MHRTLSLKWVCALTRTSGEEATLVTSAQKHDPIAVCCLCLAERKKKLFSINRIASSIWLLTPTRSAVKNKPPTWLAVFIEYHLHRLLQSRFTTQATRTEIQNFHFNKLTRMWNDWVCVGLHFFMHISVEIDLEKPEILFWNMWKDHSSFGKKKMCVFHQMTVKTS